MNLAGKEDNIERGDQTLKEDAHNRIFLISKRLAMAEFLETLQN